MTHLYTDHGAFMTWTSSIKPINWSVLQWTTTH